MRSFAHRAGRYADKGRNDCTRPLADSAASATASVGMDWRILSVQHRRCNESCLPAGLKVESETFVEVNPDYEEDTSARLTETEAVLLQTVDHHGRISVADLEHRTGITRTTQTVARLAERCALMISEKLVERYRAKRETIVSLAFPHDDTTSMHRAFDSVRGAPKQEQLLIALIDMLNKKRHEGRDPEVLRADLLTSTGLSTAIVSALSAKGIIRITTREVNRFRVYGSGHRHIALTHRPPGRRLLTAYTSDF